MKSAPHATGARPALQTPRKWPDHVALTLRLATPGDDRALHELSVLSGGGLEPHPYLLAVMAGTLVAATPLGGETTLVDPFRPAGGIVALLELRATELRRLLGDRRVGR